MPAGPSLLAVEVFVTITAVFVFGSIRYRIDKNVITYGALPVIGVTFFSIWWPHSPLREAMTRHGWAALLEAARSSLLTVHGLEQLIHGDTMLFILGLTFFVSVISQSRLLETISMSLLQLFEGRIFLTVFMIAGLVSFASGFLDGVSMIGLTIRVLVIILVMSKCRDEAITLAIMVAVVLTTVCGMWLAYGEPPNLIMKSNLGLTNSFFLAYTMPMAVVAFAIVVLFLRPVLRGITMPLAELDVLEQHLADVRFLQAVRKGEVREAEEFLQAYHPRLGERASRVTALYHEGHHPISAMVRAEIAPDVIRDFVEEYLDREFVEPVISYYSHRVRRSVPGEREQETAQADAIGRLLEEVRLQRRGAQAFGGAAFIPFVGLLIWHSYDHGIPLFLPSFIGFACAFLGILAHPKIRRLALRDAAHEYKEYLFLFPLFLSITMLATVGFFDQMKSAIERGVLVFGYAHVAVIQHLGASLLSAMLDNNVVADFASRAVEGMPRMPIFAAAQVAGYAVGGSLTHIGSAQSVVAFAYILRHIDPHFTPLGWIRAMWRLVASITLALIPMIYLIAFLYG